MIVVRIKGGLGNQLFQYAAGYALAKRLGQSLGMNVGFTSNMTVQAFRLPSLFLDSQTLIQDDALPQKVNVLKNKYVNKLMRVLNVDKHRVKNGLYWLETRYEYLPEFFTIDAENIYMDGYFQSDRYFGEFRSDLIRQFIPNYFPEKPYTEVLERIKSVNAVAVHVRRGDFVKDKLDFHYILDTDYYRRAIEYISQKIENPQFFWFSNDMQWVENNFGEKGNYHFVKIKTKHGDIDDLMLMRSCKHIITANSTFSWWAAWLNEHEDCIRIVPEKPYGMEGMIPDNWVKR